jgi:1-deoxy-D-xylulose-5-phosphate reductoisomerase
MLKKIAILGSTGFIGRNTLEIVRAFPDRFQVAAISAGSNIDLLEQQILEFKPKVVALAREDSYKILKERLSGNCTKILWGIDGLIEVATHNDVDIVMSAIVGAAGLVPTMAAIKAKKDVALANKESLVMAGSILMEEVKKAGINLIPVDSEHSAIFQSLEGQRKEDVKRLILTASGGPFLNTSKKELEDVTPEKALRHPKWKMGKKITIDSATLMNKGLEVIEARWLFDLPPDRISVHIHPQSIVHSMVEYIDGSILAQLAPTDMKGPISYALAYPERLKLNFPALNLCDMEGLTFYEPDVDRFPALKLAYDALKDETAMPIILNGADEIAVQAFLDNKIPFNNIPWVINETMMSYNSSDCRTFEEILTLNKWSRKKANEIIEQKAFSL